MQFSWTCNWSSNRADTNKRIEADSREARIVAIQHMGPQFVLALPAEMCKPVIPSSVSASIHASHERECQEVVPDLRTTTLIYQSGRIEYVLDCKGAYGAMPTWFGAVKLHLRGFRLAVDL